MRSQWAKTATSQRSPRGSSTPWMEPLTLSTGKTRPSPPVVTLVMHLLTSQFQTRLQRWRLSSAGSRLWPCPLPSPSTSRYSQPLPPTFRCFFCFVFLPGIAENSAASVSSWNSGWFTAAWRTRCTRPGRAKERSATTSPSRSLT